jgi:hypothetical protein
MSSFINPVAGVMNEDIGSTVARLMNEDIGSTLVGLISPL